ncbi:PIN domain-containing protein [candidate division WWE3 bacterium]|nr:PIN domain-containing protein [candidate division WWE3 bacterium]
MTKYLKEITGAALLDSNVLVYAVNAKSDFHGEALQVYNQLELGLFKGIVAHQNVLEATRVLTHGKYKETLSPSVALERMAPVLSLCRIVHPGYHSWRIVSELITKYDLKSNMVFDAYLVATMLTNDIHRVVTFNSTDFELFSEEGIEVIVPTLRE